MANWNEQSDEGRLLLRPYHLGDGYRIAHLLRCPRVTRWMPSAPRVFSSEYGESLVEDSRVGLADGRIAILGVATRAEDTLIGEVSLQFATGEVSFWLGSEYWGHGYGREALGMMMGVGVNEHAISVFRAAVLRGNEHSQKVVEACGFRFSGLRHAGHGRDRHAWLDYTCVCSPLSPMRRGSFAGKGGV